MFVAKLKLANDDTVKLNLEGDNFMSALANLGRTVSQSQKLTDEERRTVVRATITNEADTDQVQRRKYRPRTPKSEAAETPKSTAGKGPITPLRGDKGGK